MMNDQELDEAINKLALGNMEPLKEVYDELNKSIFLVAYFYTGNQFTAEDVVQDTFLKVYDRAHAFVAQGKGRAWIYGIARNLAMQCYVKEHRLELTDSYDELPSAEASIMELVEQSEEMKAILSVLSNKEQNIVVLHKVLGVKQKDIAAGLGLPPGSVSWSYSNALKKMKKYCIAHGIGYSRVRKEC